MKNHEIAIYTDGAARGNPGPGGYGIVLKCGKLRKELSEGFRLTTNNRMELLAVIVALESLKIPKSIVNIYTDSKYVSDAVNQQWIQKWQKNGFKKIKNTDLWKRFLDLYPKHNVKLIWVKGHSGNIENEVCDKLAVTASLQTELLVDEEYENTVRNESGNILF